MGSRLRLTSVIPGQIARPLTGGQATLPPYRWQAASPVVPTKTPIIDQDKPASRSPDRLPDVPLGLRLLLDGLPQQVSRFRVQPLSEVGVVVLESRRELIGVLEDVVDRTRHRHHLSSPPEELLTGAHRVDDDHILGTLDETDLEDGRGLARPDRHGETLSQVPRGVSDKQRVLSRLTARAWGTSASAL